MQMSSLFMYLNQLLRELRNPNNFEDWSLQLILRSLRKLKQPLKKFQDTIESKQNDF